MNKSHLILIVVLLACTRVSAAEFYDNPANANNPKCVEYTSKTVEAMKMQAILKDAITAEKAKPTPAILQTYYEIYDSIEVNSKGVLDSCELSKEEKEGLFNIGVHAAQMKAGINFTLNKK